eukprot:TRINITY_DN109872_c0_g1_i1.p1 TRINITY_DN109872_c0_g1~~TRINITY_DN109872_c0_g1_i1.p1  ORF type:complete len:413 (+),score=93.40 TRINITY_DN109872_c0_g1_i1:76-1314(+)
MIRLYPKVVQRDKDIQELRQELAQKLAENEEKIGKLTEAAVEINGLTVQLSTAEQAQEILVSENDVAKHRTNQLRQYNRTSNASKTDLTQQLARFEEEYVEKLAGLAQAEMNSARLWNVLSGVDTRNHDLSSRLGRLDSSIDDVVIRCEKEEVTKAELGKRWDVAVDLATCQRRQVDIKSFDLASLCDETVVHEERASQLKAEVEELNSDVSKLQSSIAEVDCFDTKNSEARSEIENTVKCGEELRDSLTLLDEKNQELSIDLNECREAEHTLSSTLTAVQKAVSDHRRKLSDVTAKRAEMQLLVSQRLRKYTETTELRLLNEQRSKEVVADLQKKLSAVSAETQKLISQEEQLDEQISDLQRQLELTETEKAHLLEDMEKKDQVHENMILRKAELDHLLLSEQKKLRCVIS